MGRVLVFVAWLLVCQAASARTFVLCQDSCCADEFCGPVQNRRLCATEAMMCGFTKTLEPPEAITPAERSPSLAVICRTESKQLPPPTPLIYFHPFTQPQESLPAPPPVPPPQLI